MASKLNIFQALPQQASDSEEEDFQKKSKRVDKRDERKVEDKSKGVKKTTSGKPEEGKPKDPKKERPDRHSASGHSAYGGKPKKGGAGKGNWGKAGEERVPEEGEEEKTQEVEEEEKPEGITLQEYYQQQKFVSNQPQINEAKAKITSEQLRKELGNSTLLKSRATQEVDDRKAGKKKDRIDVNHHATSAVGDHADLLGFRTGFIDKEYRAKGEDGQPRKPAPKRTDRERENTKEEEKPETTEAVEGQEQPVEGNTEGQENRRRGGAPRGRGGFRGDRGGDRGGFRGDRGGDRDGERNYGPRKNYGGRKPEQAKINFEDESAFPKLG